MGASMLSPQNPQPLPMRTDFMVAASVVSPDHLIN